MSNYIIIPRDKSCPPVDTDQASEVFNIVDRLDCGVCDVEKDGAYSFSLRQTEDEAWVIFQREETDVAPWPEDGAAPGQTDQAGNDRISISEKPE
jgi:hypothetical protein